MGFRRDTNNTLVYAHIALEQLADSCQVTFHPQSGWLWAAPQRGGVDAGKAPLGLLVRFTTYPIRLA